ncbi:MAG TPA: hypothetical protein VGJ53_06250 [Micromonosporaceae bacterium]
MIDVDLGEKVIGANLHADGHTGRARDRAIFFLTQTVVRGMVGQGRGGAIVNIGSMWPTRPRGNSVVWLLAGQGRAARAYPQTGHRAGAVQHPGQLR